jgi:hypothetical protein
MKALTVDDSKLIRKLVAVWLIPGDQPRCQPARLNPELERMLGQ